jgi:hypothetical protein
MFCKHKWEKIVETTNPALFASAEPGFRGKNLPECIFRGKHIVIMACEKCGKVYKSVEDV